MTSTRDETVLGNARIVLTDRVIERGWIAFADGRIAEFGEGSGPAGSEDAAGDLIMPGLIEPLSSPMMGNWRHQASPRCWIP
jgi:alpha-D-ribose 1-methylphosphonate 5-triphosphate diphosphatase